MEEDKVDYQRWCQRTMHIQKSSADIESLGKNLKNPISNPGNTTTILITAYNRASGPCARHTSHSVEEGYGSKSDKTGHN